MKKKASIALLFLFLCYQYGYYFFFLSYEKIIEKSWQEKIFEEDFLKNSKQYFLEIPLSVPYMGDQEDFQITNTTFEKNGRQFRAIKQRYSKDTLQIVYIADDSRTRLKKVYKDWLGSATSAEIPGKGKVLKFNFFKDFTYSLIDFKPLCINFLKTMIYPFLPSNLSGSELTVPYPPPEGIFT